MTKKYYITTPLYYVNSKPHIGHAYTNILTDTFARFHYFSGGEVFFMTGTDEYGTKIAKAAKDAGKDPKAYVDEIVPEFKHLWKALDIHYDYFIRTTDPAHERVVQNILENLKKSGDIYESSYEGWYCLPCESFWTDLQLADGKCPDCHREVQKLSEANFFFRLSKYQTWLVEHIEKNHEFIVPSMRRNEILSFLKQPLEDLCISRARSRLSWGIDYPGAPHHVVYVWFDALINYVSGVGYTVDEKKFRQHWPADAHIVGKDILRQHAIYWPIMLKACGLEPPHRIVAHGWWTVAGSKVSKSRGNAVDPLELSTRYGVDAFRYYLLREVTVGYDGAFSEELLRERYTSDLANDLGNLWFRIAAMLGKYFEGRVPEYDPTKFPAGDLAKLYDGVSAAMLQYDPRQALTEIWNVITRLNQSIEEHKPWVLAKDPAKQGELADVLGALSEWIAHLAAILLPLLPVSARKMLAGLQLDSNWVIRHADEFAKPFLKKNQKVEKGEALFPRLEE